MFFREVLKRGSHQIPTKGPVIFVAAPHANQFVDPLVIMQTCPRPVRFLMAASSMKRGIPGFFGRLLRCIPVVRPQDLSSKGAGKVSVDRLRVMGKGTKFTKLFKEDTTSFAISSPPNLFSSVVERVESDTLLFLRKPLDSTDISGEYDNFFSIPIVDQTEVYNSVFEVLERGECLGIFPEGGSHDRAEMLPLKAGVTIMALGAMARNPDLEVTIVPCGLNYFNPDKFRSRAIVEYGEPLKIDKKLVDLFKEGGNQRREACGRLLDQIYYSLCSVTINVPDFETLQVMQATRRLYQPASKALSTFELLEITRRFIRGYLKFKDDPRVRQLLSAILEYNRLLNNFRLHDHQVRTIEISFTRASILFIIQLLRLTIYAVTIFPGILINLPAILAIDYISKKKAQRAVATSTVKIYGRDVLATWKVIIGFVLLPLLYSLYSSPLVFEMWKQNYHLSNIIIVYLISSLIVLPWLSYVTVRVAEGGFEVYSSIRPLWYSLTRPHYGEVLRNLRHRLKREIIKIVDEYGPKLFGDFEAERIVPSRRPSITNQDDTHQQSNPGSSEREIEKIMEKARSISRTSSPGFAFDSLDTVMNGFDYMRARVHSVFKGSREDLFSPVPNISDWSYVDPIEIDDIFFTSATINGNKKID